MMARLLIMLLALAATEHGLAACIVVGAPTAVLQTADGTVSPVALVRDCASVRLKQGQATALWTGRSGEAGAGAVRSEGPPLGYPTDLPTDTSGGLRAVYDAVTGSGVQFRAGYRRSQAAEDMVDVYVAPTGLVMPWRGPGLLQVKRKQGHYEELVASITVAQGQRAAVPESALLPLAPMVVEFIAESGAARVWVRRMSPLHHRDIESALLPDEKASHLSRRDASLSRALVFEHFGLRFNRDLVLIEMGDLQ